MAERWASDWTSAKGKAGKRQFRGSRKGYAMLSESSKTSMGSSSLGSGYGFGE